MQERPELYEIGLAVIVFCILNHSCPCLQLVDVDAYWKPYFCWSSLCRLYICPHLDSLEMLALIVPLKSISTCDITHKPRPHFLNSLKPLSKATYPPCSVFWKQSVYLVIHYESLSCWLQATAPEDVIHRVLDKCVSCAGSSLFRRNTLISPGFMNSVMFILVFGYDWIILPLNLLASSGFIRSLDKAWTSCHPAGPEEACPWAVGSKPPQVSSYWEAPLILSWLNQIARSVAPADIPWSEVGQSPYMQLRLSLLSFLQRRCRPVLWKLLHVKPEYVPGFFTSDLNFL